MGRSQLASTNDSLQAWPQSPPISSSLASSVENTLQHLFLVRNSLIKINGSARLDPNTTTGDGIGAEVSESVREIFKADNVPIEWEQVDVSGVESGDKHSEELFRESVASLKRNKIGLKGTIEELPPPDELLLKIHRYPTHTRCTIWSRLLQRRSPSRTRHLRQHRPHQEHPRLRHSPQERRLLHHP